MSKNKKTADGAHLSDAIRSLQDLLDDVSPEVINKIDEAVDEKFEETTEFAPEETSEVNTVTEGQASVDIDSHFDMNIPPALPGDDEQVDDAIPTLSESIVEGDIPVLNEIVKLPDGRTIPEPDPNLTIEMALLADNLPTPISDASEAAADAVKIILARYHAKPLTPEVREEIKSTIAKILENSPELEIPDSII